MTAEGISSGETAIVPGGSRAPHAFVSRSPGVEIALLRRLADGSLTFIVRMQNKARAERHGHPGGEETYLLSGELRIDRRVGPDNQPLPDVVLSAGDYVYVLPGEVHEGVAEEEGTTFLVIAPGGIDRGSKSST